MLSITQLKGVGTQLTKKLNQQGIYTLEDLLFYLPRGYQDRTQIYPIAQLIPGSFALIEASVVKQQIVFAKTRRLEIQLADTTGYVSMSLFHFSQAQREQLKTGTKIRCFGEVRFYNKRLQMIHPEYQLEPFSDDGASANTLTPIYPSTEGFSQKTWRNLIHQALLHFEKLAVNDFLPTHPYPLMDALKFCHRPAIDTCKNLLTEKKHPAQQRLAIEELVAHHLSLRKVREKIKKQSASALTCCPKILAQFYQNLAFSLTGAQERVLQEIFQDLQQMNPMLRLLQGDVGSGKTVVAAACLLIAVNNGFQAVLMAPTEILATQHAANLKKYLAGFNVQFAHLSSKIPAKKKQEIYAQIREGQAQIIVGTHAVIQEAVTFHKLGLIVIDEQHRFGVEQRLKLQSKGQAPHQLMMTATPIPRTLAMTIYADLDYSVIDELPPQRKPITTVALPNSKRESVIAKIRDFCAKGQQVYWVCTLIEESEILIAQAATHTYENLKAALPEIKVALIHGQLKTAEKQTIMHDFKQNKIQLLIATTVIEVGVDVPNANLMIIENPERLGLSQLHQLRGRIGRGQEESHCILLYQSPLSYYARLRLDIMRKTQDGFEIAEQDLQLRGSGEFLGTKQSGELHFKIADLGRDQLLIPQMQQWADFLLREQPQLIAPLIERWFSQKLQYHNT